MFEITNLRVINSEKAPYLKAMFTAKFKSLELNKMSIRENRNGELYVQEPTDKPYDNRDGKTIYPKFYYLDRELKDSIAEAAILKLHEQDVKTAKKVMTEDYPPLADDDIPF